MEVAQGNERTLNVDQTRNQNYQQHVLIKLDERVWGYRYNIFQSIFWKQNCRSTFLTKLQIPWVGRRSSHQSSKSNMLSYQLLEGSRFQYRSFHSPLERARQWWHTWIPVHDVLSKRNIFFNQLQSPLTSVVAKSNASWVIHLPAFFWRFGPKGSPQAPASGCRPSQREFRLHVSLL